VRFFSCAAQQQGSLRPRFLTPPQRIDGLLLLFVFDPIDHAARRNRALTL
jgi:hypothetical protein